MEPLTFAGTRAKAIERIKATLDTVRKVRIIEEREDYLRVEFRSAWLRFVDDVEFYIDQKSQVVHFRSASRLGLYDLGVNRKRMEKFCAAFRQM